MAHLVDTNVLGRQANRSDAQHGVALHAANELHRRGEILHLTPWSRPRNRRFSKHLTARHAPATLGMAMTGRLRTASARREWENLPSRLREGPYCYLKNPGFEPCRKVIPMRRIMVLISAFLAEKEVVRAEISCYYTRRTCGE